MSKRNIFLILAVFIGACIAFYYYHKYRIVPAIDIKKLELFTTDGKPFDYNSLAGKKLVVSFYASWCGNCLHELKEISKIKNTELSDIEIVCITDDPVEKIEAYRQSTGYPYLFIKLNKQFPEIGIHSIPVTYIVNEKLEVVEEYLGYVDWKDASTVNHIKSLY